MESSINPLKMFKHQLFSRANCDRLHRRFVLAANGDVSAVLVPYSHSAQEPLVIVSASARKALKIGLFASDLGFPATDIYFHELPPLLLLPYTLLMVEVDGRQAEGPMNILVALA